MSGYKRHTWLVLVCGLVLIFAVVVDPADVFARAGGGGGFSSGGGGFSSGGGGGFSGGSFSSGSSFRGGGGVKLPPWMVIAIIVVVIVISVIAKMNESQGRASASTRRASSPRSYHRPVSPGQIEQLKRTDPDFDVDAFLNRFQTAFYKIQQAWSAQDLSDVRHFMSDRVFERFTLQLQEQRDLGYRNIVERVNVFQRSIAEIDTSSMFDVVSICVTASAVDYRVSLENGNLISGNATSTEQFTEYWTLVRRRGARSVEAGKGLFEGHCPNCGAEVKLNRLGNCSSCDSVIRSGEYDWVLSEITQACVWAPLSREQSGQAEQFRHAADPGFSIHHLTDRASVIFWRKAMADRLGELAPLLKVATDEFCDAYESNLRMEATGRRYHGNCSVGSISLLRVIRDEDADRCLVCVHYSAHDFHRARDGRVSDQGNWRRYRYLMVLRRNKGVISDVSQSLRSAQCPSCGAPETDLASHACEFCNEVLNQGRFGWVLEDYVAWSSPEANRWLNRSTGDWDITTTSSIAPHDDESPREGPAGNPLDALAWMIKVLAADGKIHEREKEQLNAYARRYSISSQAVKSLLGGGSLADVQTPQPPDRKTARAWLGQMIEMALVDGEISREEQGVLVEVGRSTGLTDYDINLEISKRRAQLKKAMRRDQLSPPASREDEFARETGPA